MEFERYSHPKTFLTLVEPILLRNEAVNNLPLGILYGLANEDSQTEIDKEYLLAVVKDAHDIRLILVKTAKNIIVAQNGPGIEEAVRVAIDALREEEFDIPGIIGNPVPANAFAQVWKEHCQGDVQIAMNQRIYQLNKVNNISLSKGKLRTATMDEVDMISKWIYAFAEEVNDPMTQEQSLRSANRLIEKGSIYVWEYAGQVVTMANKTRPTKHGIVINCVYTPPEYRKQGYASSCVAGLSQLLLDEGYQFCALYTDLTNPTSNKIYMNIGYEAIADSIMYQFDKPKVDI